MKVLLTGKNGQLGQGLQKNIPLGIEVIAIGRKDLDLTDLAACKQLVRKYKPDWLINTAAYTAVDLAEKEIDLAMAVNVAAPATLADEMYHIGGNFLQISTDFVFNGFQGYPYQLEQVPDPISTYGRTKALGEQAVLKKLGSQGRGYVLRTSWLYGPLGNNFCLTMLRLHDLRSQSGEPLEVVVDQVGCPTASHTLAKACWSLIDCVEQGDSLPSILHWSDAGVASWYDFAVAIGELGVANGLLKMSADVQPLRTDEYPTDARRPSYSLLDTAKSRKFFGLQALHWRKSLSEVLHIIKRQQ